MSFTRTKTFMEKEVFENLYFIGIDPGLSGAVAVIRPQRDIVIWDTPVIPVKKGKRSKNEYDIHRMAKIIGTYEGAPPVAHVFIEKVHAMPGQGVTSMFGFGRGFGIWEGIIAACRMPMTYVIPQAWKKVLMAGMGDKDDARRRACELYPEHADLFARKKDIGRADALLIAEYGRRTLKS